MIKIHLLRFNPETDKEPHFESYEIEKTPQMKILDGLNEINKKYNEDISFRSSCRAGQCGSCGILVNGNGALACKEEIEDGMTIEPLNLPVIKDLVVDREEIENKQKDLNLFINTKEKERTELETDLKNSELQDTKKLRTCIECYSCLSTCPIVKKFKEEYAGPYFMRYLSKFDFDPRDKEDRLEDSISEGLYDCTSCGKCLTACPKNINTFGDAIEKLRTLAYEKDLGPLDPHKKMKEQIISSGRSVSKDEEGFIEKFNKKETKSKVALFTGCMLDYRFQKVGNDLIDVLKANNIEIDVPEGQVCCGSPLLRTGQRDAVQELVNINKEVFKDYDTVITVCAGCGATLKNNHPEFGSNLNVQDISEFLIDKLDTSKMKPINMTVTWHDPCHLIRGQSIKNQPREIIKMIPGIKFVEMEESDQCCGAGGGVKSAKPEIALSLARDRAKMIEKTGADAVISICPFCQYNIQDGLNTEGLNHIKVMNLIELLKMTYA